MIDILLDLSMNAKINNTDQILVKYFLNQREKLIELSLEDVIYDTGLSKSSIIRFCKSIKTSHFTDFKKARAGRLRPRHGRGIGARRDRRRTHRHPRGPGRRRRARGARPDGGRRGRGAAGVGRVAQQRRGRAGACRGHGRPAGRAARPARGERDGALRLGRPLRQRPHHQPDREDSQRPDRRGGVLQQPHAGRARRPVPQRGRPRVVRALELFIRPNQGRRGGPERP